jgi:hypothetical protein
LSSDNKRDFLANVENKTLDIANECLNIPLFSWAISNIPVFGPLLQTILTSLEPEILKRRFLELFMALREEVLLIDEAKIDKTYFQSEEFYDIFRQVFEYTAKTRDTHKIKLYAKILVKVALLDNAIFRQSAEDFLLIILELSPADLFVAREVYKQQKDTPEEILDINQNELKIVKESGWDKLPQICEMNKAQFDLSLSKLVRAGLLRQVIGTYGYYIGDAYRITLSFRMMMKLLEKLE